MSLSLRRMALMLSQKQSETKPNLKDETPAETLGGSFYVSVEEGKQPQRGSHNGNLHDSTRKAVLIMLYYSIMVS